ncbi:MAG: MBL fold metallo-hydrolase [Myxococcota bacterium]|jgi:ribonuclease BN (tRNA processing enzyme)|nr:MBL fold metallo-hydrolase [Myxococcota bacterium]
MQVVVLGSGTAAPDPQRGAPSLLVVCDGDAVLLDCGSGCMQRLARAGVAPQELSAILITHAHLDHWGELAALLFALRRPGGHRELPIQIHCSAQTAALFRRLDEALAPMLQPPCGVELCEQLEQSFQIGALRVSAKPVEHHASSIGFVLRAPSGARLAYVGDCGSVDSAVALCQDVDLAVLECSNSEEHELPGHLGPQQIAEICQRARPGHALLCHIPPGRDEQQLLESVRHHGCSTPVSVAFDGLGLSLEDE